MRVRYSFSSRKTRKTKNIRKQRTEFPKLLLKVVETSDIILQVLDARFIEETRNKEVEELIKSQNKKIIYVLNKSDLISKIDKSKLEEIKPYVLVSCIKRKGGKELRNKIKQEAKKVKKDENNTYDRIQVGVIGYPNAGKSSIINLLIGKSSAKTGSEAGFTKGLQKLKLTKDMHLLDSPGVIPEREYSSDEKAKIARYTIVGGRSFSQVRDPDLIIDSILKQFPNVLEKHYRVDSENDVEILLEKLGKKFNYLKKGGVVDEDKTARRILKEWQTGVIRIS